MAVFRAGEREAGPVFKGDGDRFVARLAAAIYSIELEGDRRDRCRLPAVAVIRAGFAVQLDH